jgi:VanZ family protein
VEAIRVQRPRELRFFTLFLRFWLPVLAYVTIIVVLSAQPHLEPPIKFANSDKFYHLAEYFALGVLLARAIRATMRLPLPAVAALMALSLGILVGTGDEFFQSYVPGRQSSAFDLLADTAGLALAQLAYLAFARE